MINSTPKKDYLSQKISLRNTKKLTPSKLTINLIMGYAAAVKVCSTESIGQTNILLN
jgi:hypothetical protein